jgi:hypothetical protein
MKKFLTTTLFLVIAISGFAKTKSFNYTFKDSTENVRLFVLKLPIFPNFLMFEQSEIFGMFGLKTSESG